MKSLVRQLAKLLTLAAFVALSSVAAYAQNDSGVVVINGSVGKAAAIRWWSFTALNSETGANTPASQNSPLNFTLNIGDVSPNATPASGYAGGTVQVILRTNAAYTLSAQVTASSGFGAAGNTNGDIALTDVGYGLSGLAASGSGALVMSNAVSGSAFSGSFGNNPSTAAKDGDGIPTFTSSLNNLSASSQVMGGPRISRGGSVNSPNNGLLVNTHYAVGPQFFTPTTFTATVTYTLATP